MLRKIGITVGILLLLGGLGIVFGDSNDQRTDMPIRETTEAEPSQIVGPDGMTALEQALIDNRYGDFLELLGQGVNPNAIGWHGSTAVHLAAQHRNHRYLEKLLDHGGDPNAMARRMKRTPIFNAMDSRLPKNRDLLIARGADIEYADTSGIRPLRHAANINDFDGVWRFLQLGADPTATDDLGSTFQSSFFRTNSALLSWSAKKRRRQVIEFLNERGIPLDPKAERVP